MIDENKKTQPTGGAAPAPAPAQPSAPHGSQEPRPFRRYAESRRKVCRLCAEKIAKIDYKNIQLVKTFMMDSGKILSRRITGTCAKHQRQVVQAVKRNRNMAILPYCVS